MTKPLTVGVDIRDLKIAKTGVKTYLEELCREFSSLVDPEIKFHFLDTSLPVYTGKAKAGKWLEHFRYQTWKQIVLPLKAWSKKCDIVFCADNCVPYIHLGYQTIPVIHDAFCFESPENYGKLWLWLYKHTTVPGANRSPFVITVTAYGKKQIAHYSGIPADKLVVVHEAGKRVNYQAENTKTDILKKFSLPAGNYILHVGAMFKRKNIPHLLRAFIELKKTGYPGLKLVLAGSLVTNKFDNDHQLILDIIQEANMANDVIITGYLTDHEVGQLYSHALLYVFPSLNEGFGLPVLEAFAHNLPVLVANNTCLPEVGGDAVLLFDPYQVDEITAQIKKVLDNPGLREDLIGKGQRRLQDFSWQATAQQIVAVFKRVGK